MKNITLLLLLLSASLKLNAQQRLYYGPAFGAFMYTFEAEGPILGSDGGSMSNVGFYVDYQVNDTWGINTKITYGSEITEGPYREFKGVGQGYDTFPENHLSLINLMSHYKLDINSNYNTGLYLLAGARATFILDAKDENGVDKNDFYKGNQLGLQLGFGFNWFSFIGLELVGDYGITDTVAEEVTKFKTRGVYLNLTIDIEPLVNKAVD